MWSAPLNASRSSSSSLMSDPLFAAPAASTAHSAGAGLAEVTLALLAIVALIAGLAWVMKRMRRFGIAGESRPHCRQSAQPKFVVSRGRAARTGKQHRGWDGRRKLVGTLRHSAGSRCVGSRNKPASSLRPGCGIAFGKVRHTYTLTRAGVQNQTKLRATSRMLQSDAAAPTTVNSSRS